MLELPPVRVISLARATDRREFVDRVFADAGIAVEIVDAVDGTALTSDQEAKYSPWRTAYTYGHQLGRGMFACSLSHFDLWRTMVDQQLPELVVFEDDTRPLPGFTDVVRSRDRWPDDWDVVTLHSLFEWAGPQLLDGESPALDHHLCTFARTPMGTQAYVLRLRAAERLLAVGFPVALPPDELLYRPRPAGLTVYGVDPPPVVHEDFPSELRATPAPMVDMNPARSIGLAGARFAGRVARRARKVWRSPAS